MDDFNNNVYKSGGGPNKEGGDHTLDDILNEVSSNSGKSQGVDKNEFGAGDTELFVKEPKPKESSESYDDFFDKLQSTSPKRPESKSNKGKTAKGKSGKNGKTTKGKQTWSKILKVALGVFCFFVIVGCVVAVLLSVYLMKETQDDENELDLNSIKLNYATVLLAENLDYNAEDPESPQYLEYQRIFGEENRVWIDYVDMPEHLINALIASEDRRFWSHKGVDWKRTFGAFLTYAGIPVNVTGGGSTIDQQLIKNITDEKESTGLDGALRKVREIYRALVMENRFSKEQVLEAYLNTFRLSGQVAGIEAAANYYFDKETKDLTVAECAAILCITKAPGKYNPFNEPENNKSQRDQILWDMYDLGYLTDAEYAAAQAESDSMVFQQSSSNFTNEGTWSYYTDTAVREVLRDLEEVAGYSAAEAYDLLYNQGLTVYLNVDVNIQDAMERAMVFDPEDEELETVWPTLTNEYTASQYNEETGEYEDVTVTQYTQGAMVVMDMSGNLKGVVGGLGEKEGDRVLNRAVESLRSTGSSMKPIAAYGPALEADKIHYSLQFPDTPSQTVNGRPWPTNYSNTYNDPVTVYAGVQQSLNTTAIHVYNLIGQDFAFDFITTRLGISTLVDERIVNGTLQTDRTMSLALGGVTDGISLYEMCAAYQSFGNGGWYNTPYSYSRVVSRDGTVILDSTQSRKTIKAFSDQTAFIMNKILQGVMISGGTGYYANFNANGIPTAGKSGTTSDNYDYWFIGMTPYYVCGVWQGFDQPAYMRTVRPHPTQLAFRQVMSEIHEDLEYINFPTAEGVISLTYCKATGEIAGPGCPETATGWYKEGGMMPGQCVHIIAPTPPVEPAA